MSTLVLCNVGVRDLQVEGVPDNRCEGARVLGQRLLENLDEWRDKISAPLIAPVLEYVHRSSQLKNSMRLVLFVTDQAQEIPKKLRAQDTIYFGQVLREVLPHVVGFPLSTEVRAIPKDLNPSVPDEMYEAYGDMLRDYGQEWEHVHVVISGGIPACNSALLLQALRRFADRCQPIYQPYGGDPIVVRIADQIRENVQEEIVLDRLGACDFAAARAGLKQLDVGTRGQCALAIVDYGLYRTNFDFEQATQALREAERFCSGEARSFAAESRQELEQLQGRDSERLLQELYLNARITWNQGRYVDFLGRLFRFDEAVLRHLVEQVLHLPTEENQESLRGWQEGILADKGLCQFLQNKGLQYHKPNRRVLRDMLSYVLVPDARGPSGKPYLVDNQRDKIERITRILDGWQRLTGLRNKSIIAHGYAGIARDDIEANCKTNPVEDMRTVLHIMGCPPPRESSMDRIGPLVRRELLGAR